jgi:hypothetical protein
MVFEMYDFVFQMCVNKGAEICVNECLLCVKKNGGMELCQWCFKCV